jgi:hypothetical protein
MEYTGPENTEKDEYDSESDNRSILPYSTDFEPGQMMDLETRDQQYREYAEQVRELVRQTVGSKQPLLQALYDEEPDFWSFNAVIGWAAQSGNATTRMEADSAIAEFSGALTDQSKVPDLHARNEFYGHEHANPRLSGLGWQTQYGVENDREAARTDDPATTMNDAIKGALVRGRDKAWGKAWGGKGLGGAFATGSTLRGGKSFKDYRGTEILMMVSRALFNYVNAWVGKEESATEVQALCVANRIVVCANEELAKTFLRTFGENELPNLRGTIKAVADDQETYGYRSEAVGAAASVLDQVHANSIKSLSELTDAEKPQTGAPAIEGVERVEEAEDPATVEQQMLQSVLKAVEQEATWKVGTYDEAVAWLNSADTEYGVFWMDPPQDLGACHAEGALVALLVASGLDQPAIITGTMRPCTGCFLTLRFARERLRVNLVGAPTHNGGFWEGTQTGGMLALIYAFINRRLDSLPAYRDADKDGKAAVREAFQMEGVDAFCRFVERNFPDSSNATNLHSFESEPYDGAVPYIPFRRTPSLKLSQELDFTAKKAAVKRRRNNDDGEFMPSDEDDTGEYPAEPEEERRSERTRRAAKERKYVAIDSEEDEEEEGGERNAEDDEEEEE